MPEERFSQTAITPAPRAKVWGRLDKPATWEGIGGVDRVVDAVIDIEGRLVSFIFETRIAGRPYRGRSTSRQRVEGWSMGWDIDSSELEGIITVDLADHDKGTLVTVTIEMSSRGMLSAMFFPAISAALGSGMKETVEGFAAGLATD